MGLTLHAAAEFSVAHGLFSHFGIAHVFGGQLQRVSHILEGQPNNDRDSHNFVKRAARQDLVFLHGRMRRSFLSVSSVPVGNPMLMTLFRIARLVPGVLGFVASHQHPNCPQTVPTGTIVNHRPRAGSGVRHQLDVEHR